MVDPPMALWMIMAFSNACSVIIRLGHMPRSTRVIMERPALRAHARISRMVAGISAEPGSAIPKASAIHCMVLAVPRNVHAPAEGHPVSL